MASRKDIREAFRTNLVNAVSGLVPSDRVALEQGERPERLPSVVYDDAYRKVPMNQGSNAPTRVERDNNGDATAEVYTTLHEAVFSVLVVHDDEQEKEDIYESFRTYFEKYEHPAWDAADIQADVAWVRVLDSNSEDDADHEPIARGDRVEVRITFERDISNSGTAIQSVDGSMDADNDGTAESSYTSN
jgi:hypothetical protein